MMETLTLEQASYIAEIIGVIMVVISILYLAIQVKQNTDATQVTAAQSYVELYNTFTANLIAFTELTDIWYRGVNDYHGLNNTEIIQFGALLGQWYRLTESNYQQHLRGAVDNDVWTGIVNQIIDLEVLPGVQEWKKQRRHWYGSHFWEWVDSLEKKHESKHMYAYLEGR